MLAFVGIPVYLFVMCICTGEVFLKLFGKGEGKNAGKNIIAGYVICAGLFHIISTPFMYYELSFSPLVYICIAYSVVIIAAYIILKIKEEKTLFERVRLPEKNAIQKDKVWLGLSIVFIIAFQIFYVVYYQHTDIDDSYYLAQINTIIHTNKISAIDPASGIAELNFNPQYKMVSYEVLMSFIVRLFHVNTAFFMHTILPVFLIPVHYIVIYQIGKFISQRYAYHFVLLYSVFNLFSAYSGYSQGAFLLYRIWQGKSGVINIIVPILILTFLYICDKKDITVTDIIFTGMVLVAGLHATAVGIYLVPVAYFTLVAGNFLIYRNIKNTCKLVVPVGIVMPFVLLKAYILFTSSLSSRASVVENVTDGSEALNFITEFVEKYMAGYSMIILLYGIAVLYLLIYGNKKIKAVVVMPSIVLMITFVNPFLINFIAQHVTGTPVYWRLYWLLEIPLVIVTMFVVMMQEEYDRHGKVFAGIGVVIIAISGSFILNGTGFEYRSNKYKLDSHAVQIADSVNADIQNQSARLLLPLDWSYGVREYCGNIELLINRYTDGTFQSSGKGDELEELYDELVNPLYVEKEWNSADLYTGLKKYDVDYVVIFQDALVNNQISDSLIKIFSNEEYGVYQVK